MNFDSLGIEHFYTEYHCFWGIMTKPRLDLFPQLAALAALCVQHDVEFRPYMSNVVKILSSILKDSPPPPPDAPPPQPPNA